MSDPVATIKYREQYKNTRSRSGFAFYTVPNKFIITDHILFDSCCGGECSEGKFQLPARAEVEVSARGGAGGAG